MMSTRWIQTDIAESLICCDEKASLLLNHLPKCAVFHALQSLLSYRGRLVAFRTQQIDDRFRQILVYLHMHVPTLPAAQGILLIESPPQHTPSTLEYLRQ
jgi:hypothetical protein